ncbi:hypothetical protein J6590_097735 [Homalodisca vitripennis]|nr:hypothetical protein J6590_097735 [Homalodisca vitripennis]
MAPSCFLFWYHLVSAMTIAIYYWSLVSFQIKRTQWKCSIFSEYRREHSHTVAAQQTAVRVSLVPYNPNNPPPRASN